MEHNLIVERSEGVVTVFLNRPAKMNALSAGLMEDLRALWLELAADADVRCVVVTGSGRGFCSGADVDLLASDRSDENRTVEEELAFLPGDRLDVPVIVAVNGVCAGGGLHFVADADIAIASTSATFLDPHVNVGQVTALEPLTLLPHMRPDALRRMVLLGSAERLDAAAAERAGLVSEVVPPEELLDRAHALAAMVVKGSPTAIAVSRTILRTAQADGLSVHLENGWNVLRAHWNHPDSDDGPRAWSERREPRWEQRTIDAEDSK
ncbi:enoyl-CoA hydratase/isomerase family protein [Rhodococcoides yunnanense]|uniref:enoyl-CoA hydratase/isomerase family protein n=1 Tax=Rhodococcoides yunnanense TaxID=278209 RepID=UPI0009340FD3|nr:enoyl-CoA hydratase/isomerase family protein [Rhodococcus yunnanensis]